MKCNKPKQGRIFLKQNLKKIMNNVSGLKVIMLSVFYFIVIEVGKIVYQKLNENSEEWLIAAWVIEYTEGQIFKIIIVSSSSRKQSQRIQYINK